MSSRRSSGVRHHGAARATLGKVLISVTAVGTVVGPHVADWNDSHIFNPRWTPHAKFHNAQTMSSGVVLSLAALYQVWRAEDSRASLDAAAISAVTYFVSQLPARLYPGTASVDPPGRDSWPQLKSTLPALGVVAVGYGLERRRLTRAAAAGAGQR